jgi:hypothetical protein
MHAAILIVPTLCVVMPPATLSVIAMDAERPGRHPLAKGGDDQHAEGHGSYRFAGACDSALWRLTPSRLKPVHMMAPSPTSLKCARVPTLRVVMPPATLSVIAMDAERPGRHPLAKRGDDQHVEGQGATPVGAGLLANAVGQR